MNDILSILSVLVYVCLSKIFYPDEDIKFIPLVILYEIIGMRIEVKELKK